MTGTALGSLLGTQRLLQAAKPPVAEQTRRVPRISFGFSLYGMKSLKTAEALRICQKVGYDGVELALMPGWPTEPRLLGAKQRTELRQRLADSGLALMGLMENLREPADDANHRKNLDRLKAAAELGHTLSPKAPPPIETVLGGRPAQWDKLKERMAARLQDWVKVAETSKTVIAVKPHVGGALHTPEGALWLVKQCKSRWLRLAYDYSHFALRKFDLKRSLEILIPHTAFIHVKDSRGTAARFQFLLPGEGKTDYGRYFALLAKLGYRGPVVVEVSGQISRKRGYDPAKAARTSHAHLAPALRKAGVRKK